MIFSTLIVMIAVLVQPEVTCTSLLTTNILIQNALAGYLDIKEQNIFIFVGNAHTFACKDEV